MPSPKAGRSNRRASKAILRTKLEIARFQVIPCPSCRSADSSMHRRIDRLPCGVLSLYMMLAFSRFLCDLAVEEIAQNIQMIAAIAGQVTQFIHVIENDVVDDIRGELKGQAQRPASGKCHADRPPLMIVVLERSPPRTKPITASMAPSTMTADRDGLDAERCVVGDLIRNSPMRASRVREPGPRLFRGARDFRQERRRLRDWSTVRRIRMSGGRTLVLP